LPFVVDLPDEQWGYSIVMLVYQRVSYFLMIAIWMFSEAPGSQVEVVAFGKYQEMGISSVPWT
jgi:hypothetical protein